MTSDIIEDQITSIPRPYFGYQERPVRNECISLYNFGFDLEKVGQLVRSGLTIIDHNRTILVLNRSAVTTLADGDGIRVAGKSLLIEKAYVQRSFDLLLAKIHAADTRDRFDAGQCPCIGIPDRKGAVRYVLRVMDAQSHGSDTAILLTIIDLADRVGPTRETFAVVFRMSEREAELAELFARGFRLEEIALEMTISLNTARVHLRNVFTKTNCSGQAELMRMVSRFI